MQGINFVLNKLLFTFAFIFIACLSACSNNGKTTAFTPATAITDKALVYLYRPTEMANALYSPGINIDNTFNFYAKNSLNTKILLPPGDHIFTFQAEKKYSDLNPLSVKLEAGLIYFIRIDSSLKINNTNTYEPYLRSFKLTLVNALQARLEITECCIAKTKKNTNKTKETPTNEKYGGGFSVDKTQNPFSH